MDQAHSRRYDAGTTVFEEGQDADRFYLLLDGYGRYQMYFKSAFEKLNISIHQFSKRQATWFRKMERNGFDINWIDGNLPLEEKIERINKKISL